MTKEGDSGGELAKIHLVGELIKQALHEDDMDYRQIRFGKILNEHLSLPRWKRDILIIENYMPPYPDERTKPKTVIKYRNSFLRTSRGSWTGSFWDCYGADFHDLDLAFAEVLKCEAPDFLGLETNG